MEMEMGSEPVAKRELKKGLLERLEEGVVIGDGGMIWTLEQRGYATLSFTPEATVEHRDEVLQIHREFLHNGADVLQACTFWSARTSEESVEGVSVNSSACSVALQAASESTRPILVAGGVTKTEAFEQGAERHVVQAEVQRQLAFYIKNNFDFVVAEYIDSVVEACWAVEVLKQSAKPVMATLCIGPQGDIDSVSPQECAVRLAHAGADVVGVNCRFGPAKCLQTVAMMKEGLLAAGLTNVHLAVQPFGYHTPDAGSVGYMGMAEFPFAVEPRHLTRPDVHKYVTDAYALGVRYIGGCCGFEPKHVRAMSEALQDERGIVAPVTQRYGKWLDASKLRADTSKQDPKYWLGIEPATGRPRSSAMSAVIPDQDRYLQNCGRGRLGMGRLC